MVLPANLWAHIFNFIFIFIFIFFFLKKTCLIDGTDTQSPIRPLNIVCMDVQLNHQNSALRIFFNLVRFILHIFFSGKKNQARVFSMVYIFSTSAIHADSLSEKNFFDAPSQPQIDHSPSHEDVRISPAARPHL